MRHRVDHRKLGRTAAHRRAMMRSMVTSLFQTERITTTAPKAKEARRVAERLITRAKKGYRAHQEGMSLRSSGKDEEAQRLEAVALNHWRQAGRFVRTPDVLRKLFDNIAPHFLERNGGYTRIIRLDGSRVGDNARLVLLELVDTDVTRKPLTRGAVPEPAVAEKPAKGRKAKTKAKADETEAAEASEKKPKKGTRDKPAGGRTKSRKDAGKSAPAGKAKAKAKTKAKAKSRSRKSDG